MNDLQLYVLLFMGGCALFMLWGVLTAGDDCSRPDQRDDSSYWDGDD